MRCLLIILSLLSIICAEKSQEYEDVIYLNNGSEIRGIIIDSIPNKSVKIKSCDNIFVYQMEEIRSIEKEIIIDKKAQTFKNFSMTLGLDDAIAVGTIRNDFPIGDNSNFYATTGFGLGINMLFAGLKYDSDYKKNGISSMLSGGVSTGDDTINKSVQFSVSSKIKISKSNDFFLNLGATLFIPIDVNIVVFLPVVNFTAYF